MVIIRYLPCETNSISINIVCFLGLWLNKNLLTASMAQLVWASTLDVFGG